MVDQTPVVVTPLDDHMGLDIARSLGKRGISVFGVDSNPKVIGRFSKYCQFIHCPDIDQNGGNDYLQFMLAFGKKIGRKTVLFALSDEHVFFFSKNRVILQNYFTYIMPDDETIINLATKDGLQKIVEKFDIPAPQSIFINSDNNIESISEKINYPVLLKPVESTYWHTPQITKILRKGFLSSRAKIILCRNAHELIEAYRLIASIDDRLIVQEVVPGEDNRLLYISFYLDRNSKPLGIFAGRKHRVIPTGFGSASYAQSIHNSDLEKAALKLLSAVNYCGLGGIEFKLDPRDEQLKLIEVNTRFGMWDGLGAKCGVDLAYIAYCDAIGQSPEAIPDYQDDVKWVDWQRDFRAAHEYIKKGELTIPDWFRSLKGKKMWAIYSRDDWRPGVAFTFGLLNTFINRIISR